MFSFWLLLFILQDLYAFFICYFKLPKKIEINERNKGTKSDILKKVYSMGHSFMTCCGDKKKTIFIKPKCMIKKNCQL